MSETTTKLYTDADLRYAATARCPCGAGLAYPLDAGLRGAWDCADILTGRAIPKGEEGWQTHTDRLPFAFYEIKSEDQPSANGHTTRPRPLTEEEQLQRAAKESMRRCGSLDRQLVAARQKVRDLEAEFAAEDQKRSELWRRAFGVELPSLAEMRSAVLPHAGPPGPEEQQQT